MWGMRGYLRSSTRFLASVLVVTLCALPGAAYPENHANVAQELCAGRVPTIVGTPGPDVIRGTRGADVIDGKDGDDQIVSLGSRDHVCGGDGNDTIRGGRGDDLIQGEHGSDQLLGGTGSDQLAGWGGAIAHDGANRLIGGPGADRLTGANGNDVLLGGAGNDRLASGGGGFLPAGDLLEGGLGNDNLISELSPQRNARVRTASNWSLMRGGSADDVIRTHVTGGFPLAGNRSQACAAYDTAPRAVQADLGAGTADGEGHDTLIQVRCLVGSPFDDHLTGSPNGDILRGLAGDDILDGGPGTDDGDGGEHVNGDQCIRVERILRCEL